VLVLGEPNFLSLIEGESKGVMAVNFFEGESADKIKSIFDGVDGELVVADRAGSVLPLFGGENSSLRSETPMSFPFSFSS
jgi:hypothetical protein